METPNVALLSVYHKSQAFADFAQFLTEQDLVLWGSSGTTKFLEEQGIHCTDVATIVGDPILDHRVVTLSREVHAGLLARLDEPEDRAVLARIGIAPIGLVYVSMYPLEDELFNLARTAASLRKQIDIGGPTMLRSAAKGDRIVVSAEDQFEEVKELLRLSWDSASAKLLRLQLAREAEHRVARYAGLASDAYDFLYTMELEAMKKAAGNT